jgi:hypothetical protein
MGGGNSRSGMPSAISNSETLVTTDISSMYYAAWEGHLECMLLLWAQPSGKKPTLGPLALFIWDLGINPALEKSA